MNPAHKQVFRRMTNHANGFQVSINQAEELMARGIFANFQGLAVNTSAVIPLTKVYITADPEYFGAFVTATDLLIIDTVEDANIGYVILEEVGFIISNPKGLATIIITY